MFGSSMKDELNRRSCLLKVCSAYPAMLEGCSDYPQYCNYFTPEFQRWEIGKIELAAPMLRQAVAMMAEEKDAGSGYRIALCAEFLHGPKEWKQIFPGLALILFNPAGEPAGMLDLRLGIPITVVCVQGRSSKYGGMEEREAHNAIGRPFYEILLKHLFHCVGASFRFKGCGPLRGDPKIAFEFSGHMPSGNEVRHMAKYIKKSKRVDFIYDDRQKRAFVRPKFVSPHEAGVKRSSR